MKKQIAWLKREYSTENSIEGLIYPAIGGQEVITCDNTHYSMGAPNDKDRSGLVYSVPFYDLGGDFKGVISGVILTKALSDMLPNGNMMLRNKGFQYSVPASQDGQWKISKKYTQNVTPDPNLIYSEIFNVGNPDKGAGWKLWVGQPDSMFWELPTVVAATRFAQFGYFGSLVLVIGLMGYVAMSRRHHSKLEGRVEERTADLKHANEEIKSSQAQLVQAEKMSSLGQMIAGVAHEINTPLGYVKSNVQLIEDMLLDVSNLLDDHGRLLTLLQSPDAKEEDIEAYFEKLSSSASAEEEGESASLKDALGLAGDCIHGLSEISNLVVNLKNFARLDRDQMAKHDINAALDSTLSIAGNRIKHTAQVFKKYGDIPHIMCAPSQINQIFLNLIVNASQAFESGTVGKIGLVTKLQDNYVCVYVEDNGMGMDEEVSKHIFDPFFTTKDVGEGTGLGLSIVYKIVEQHGGKISVDSRKGVGTRFTVMLPIKQVLNQEVKKQSVA